MKNLRYLLAEIPSRIYKMISPGSVFRNAIRATSLLTLLIFYTRENHAQNIITLDNAGTNHSNFHNSTTDDLGNIYYCTLDPNNNNSLNVSCISKEYLVLWSYNYNIPNLEPVSGINHLNGKIHITTSSGDNVIILILDLFGNILFSKTILTSNPTFASAVMHNNNYLITTSYNPVLGSIQITRLTPAFTTIFNKQIQFEGRDFVYITDIRQIGNRIYFTGSARPTLSLIGYFLFGALDLNGNLLFLNEYRTDTNDEFPNNHFVSLDSISTDEIIVAGYTGDLDLNNDFKSYGHGILVKFNPVTGAVKDHLILGKATGPDFMFFLGMKYLPNKKIRVIGPQGLDGTADARGLLYGEVDPDFKNYQFKFGTDYGQNFRLVRFIDYNHASGNLWGQPIIMSMEGEKNCKTGIRCFDTPDIKSVNRDLVIIPNVYTVSNINYNITDLNVQKKPIQVSLLPNCGISTCENIHTIQICKQAYVYNYSSVQQNPNRVTNLTPQITGFIHDRIDREFILNPLMEGTAIILMETQISLFQKQLDTFKFVIINDSLPLINLGADRVLCLGDSLILNAGIDSAHWSNGSIGKTIVVRSAGNYSATYTNICGTVSDTVAVSFQQFPKLNIGSDVLICGNQTATLNSNYDNTTWSTGATGKSITVSTAGTIYAFVSTACGLTLDTVIVYKFDQSSLSAGKDQVICDPHTTLTGNFTNPNNRIYTTDIEWKQIDLLSPVTFDNTKILSPFITNLSKDLTHSFELAIRLGNNCIQKDTMKVLSKTCFIDSCAFIVEKTCLSNGMVELKAIDANANTIVPKTRLREFFWDIKDGPAGRGYSLRDKNPITVSNHTRYCLTSKIYSWPKGRPHTVEFAEICEEKSCDSLTLDCTGPCENFSFILSSCLDDYDEAYNLNFLPNFCRSVCINSCNYIVAIFDLHGQLIDPNFYTIKWSTGETGIASMQKGCFNYTLSVEVRRGDCVWHGRYRPSCEKYNGFRGYENQMKRDGSPIIEWESLQPIIESYKEYQLYDLYGRLILTNELNSGKLVPGVYFLVTNEYDKKQLLKVYINGKN